MAHVDGLGVEPGQGTLDVGAGPVGEPGQRRGVEQTAVGGVDGVAQADGVAAVAWLGRRVDAGFAEVPAAVLQARQRRRCIAPDLVGQAHVGTVADR